VASPGIHDLGAWLEQLIAESTGKIGKGLIPVDREPLGPPEVYGTDRVFAYLRLEGAPDPAQDRAIDALAAAGHPVVRISLPDAYHLGAEFFRWEIATAVAGSILEINPFDQPDVEASKIATKKLTAAYEQTGSLPPEGAFTEVNGLKVFGDLSALIHSIAPGDYFALLAYIEMNPEHETAMEALRTRVRDAKRVATCVGFGPRFLHSTGQAYKGGPNSGVFLQITADVTLDLPVPDQTYTFGVVKAAQARGDLQVLEERGRRALRVHLGSDVKAGLVALTAMAEKELAGK
jgi:transaldolase/glucose-6-phosphate isomerase